MTSVLTDKQARFVDEYMVDLNGTQAAIRAGYSERTARAIACENLKKPLISEEIGRRKELLKQGSKIKELEILEALMRIATSNLVAVYGKNGRMKYPQEWPREAQDAIASFEYREKLGAVDVRTGKRIVKSRHTRVKVIDKLRALSVLGEHLGIFPRRMGRKSTGVRRK